MQHNKFITSFPVFTWYFLKSYKLWVVSLFICATILGGWGIINAVIFANVIEILIANVNNSSITKQLFWPGIFLLLNFLAHDLVWYCWCFINKQVQSEIKSKITLFTYKNILQKSHIFFHEHNSFKISENMNTLVNCVAKFINNTSMYIFRGFAALIIALTTMYFVNYTIFLITLAWLSLHAAICYWQQQKITLLADMHVEAENNISAAIQDGIENSQNIRNFSQADYEVDYLGQKLKGMRDIFNQNRSFIIKNDFMLRLSLIIPMACLIYVLVYLKTQNKISIGSFGLILTLILDVGWTLWWVTEQTKSLADIVRRSKQCLKSLFLCGDVQHEIVATKLKVSAGKIEFKNVQFGHSNSDFQLGNKYIIIPPGQKVGIVGTQGSGKTTFVNLIMRLYDISSGCIMIDNQNINDVTPSSLHDAINYIPQDPTMFNRTIMENIKYGNYNASEFEVILAAKRAHAHEFIENLPHKYNTIIGEGGLNLTGSQKQRIAIARAMLKDAPILILDETTSQIGSLIAQEVEDSLHQFMQGKTTLVISDNLSTMQLMDRILIIENGKVIEDGTHEQLLFKGDGLYNTLWNTQVCGFI